MTLRELPSDVRAQVGDRILALLAEKKLCYDIADALNTEYADIGLHLTPNSVYLFARRRNITAYGQRRPEGPPRPRKSTVETPPPEEAVPQIVGLERKLKQRDAQFHILNRKYTELLQTANLADAIRGTVKEHIDALPPVTEPKLWTPDPNRHLTHETWGLMFSDLHWGELVRPEEVMGINWYDKETAARRCELYVEVQADLVLNHLQGYRFDEGFMFALGDAVSGDIHDELRETNLGPTFDHIFEVVILKVQMIRELLTFLPRLIVRITDDNHGRWQKKKTAKRRYVNHSVEIGHILAGLFRDEPRVEFRIEESAFTIDDIRGHGFMSMHGDTFRAWNQIPDYGIERGDMRLSRVLAAHGREYEYFLLGHFHTGSTRDRPVGQRIMNGCIKGGDEFSLNVLHTSGAPKQSVFGIHQKWGKTFQYDIDLTTPFGEQPRRWTYDFRPHLGVAYDRAVETTADWMHHNAEPTEPFAPDPRR